MSTVTAEAFSPASKGITDYHPVKKRNLPAAWELGVHIQGSILNNRESQKKIYSSFYGYAMAICDRYTNNREDAAEILNDGFLKIFKEIHHYKPAYADVVSSFKGWLGKIMVNTAIDHFRRNQKHRFTTDPDNGIIQLSVRGEDALDRMSHKEIIKSIQQLTPAYRTVLNLFIIEGFSHEEISKQLGISTGTSKSNLAKARRQLQKILFQQNQRA
jgi:RNA polymerase sigma factor (sigma-70 family)